MADGTVTLVAPDGSTVRFDAFPVVLGRNGATGPEAYCDLGPVDPDQQVQPRQTLIDWRDRVVVVTDLGTGGGTSLDGRRLRSGETAEVLHPRAQLGIGSLMLTMHIELLPATEPPPPAAADAPPPPAIADVPDPAGVGAPLPLQPTGPAPAAPGLAVVPVREQVEARAAAVESTVTALTQTPLETSPPPPVTETDPLLRLLLCALAAPAFRELVIEGGRRASVLDGDRWRGLGHRAVESAEMDALLAALERRGALAPDAPGHRAGTHADAVALEVTEPPRAPHTTLWATRLPGSLREATELLESALGPVVAALAGGAGVLVVAPDARDGALAVAILLSNLPGGGRVVVVDRRPLLARVDRPLIPLEAGAGQEVSSALAMGADLAVLVDVPMPTLAAAAAAHVQGGMRLLASVRANDPGAVQRVAGADLGRALPVTVTLGRSPEGRLAITLGGLGGADGPRA